MFFFRFYPFLRPPSVGIASSSHKYLWLSSLTLSLTLSPRDNLCVPHLVLPLCNNSHVSTDLNHNDMYIVSIQDRLQMLC